MNRLLLLALLTYTVLASESCIIEDKKVRRIELILPIRRVVRTVLLHRDYVLITLGRLAVGKVRHSRDRAGRLQGICE